MEIQSRTKLVELMKHFGLPLTVAECGCAEGIFSTELFGWGLEKLYLVDIWEHIPLIEGCASFEPGWHEKNYKEVQERFKDKPNVILLKGLSYKMAKHIPDNSLGLVYIDGDHFYEGAMVDSYMYWPKLVKGGIMAYHDARNPSYGVQRAISDFANEKQIEIHELPEDGDINNRGAYIIKK